MKESIRLQIIALVKKRIEELEDSLSGCQSISDKKRDQADDAAANLDITISASVDEKVLSEHKIELAQLNRSLIWFNSEDAGFCKECGDEIPVNRLKAILSTRFCVACAASNKQ